MWPSPFGREKILPDADWYARIGRGKRARIVREYERHAQDLADIWLDR
jgi:hypothetical protein